MKEPKSTAKISADILNKVAGILGHAAPAEPKRNCPSFLPALRETVVGDSPDCRAGSPTTSDNLRAPGNETCYPWRTRCNRGWRKVRNLKENDHGRLYLAVGNRLERG
jgi:hypothetical protein